MARQCCRVDKRRLFRMVFPPLFSPVVPSNGIITNPTVGSTYFVVNQNFKNPYVESWNAAIQRSLPWRFVLDLAYVGSPQRRHRGQLQSQRPLRSLASGTRDSRSLTPSVRTANTNLLFAAYSSSLQRFAGEIRPALLGRLRDHHGLHHSAKAWAFKRGDDGGLAFYVNQRRNYARNDFDRTHTFCAEYCVRSAVWKGQTLGFFGSWRRSFGWLAHLQFSSR